MGRPPSKIANLCSYSSPRYLPMRRRSHKNIKRRFSSLHKFVEEGLPFASRYDILIWRIGFNVGFSKERKYNRWRYLAGNG
jgi:hypothetical protein